MNMQTSSINPLSVKTSLDRTKPNTPTPEKPNTIVWFSVSRTTTHCDWLIPHQSVSTKGTKQVLGVKIRYYELKKTSFILSVEIYDKSTRQCLLLLPLPETNHLLRLPTKNLEILLEDFKEIFAKKYRIWRCRNSKNVALFITTSFFSTLVFTPSLISKKFGDSDPWILKK